MAKTNDAIEIINRRYIKNDPAIQDILREASLTINFIYFWSALGGISFDIDPRKIKIFIS